MVFSIQFRPLLYKLCLVLGLTEPCFRESGASGNDCEASVVVTDGSKEYVFSGGSGRCFLASAEHASKEMVMHLVREYELCVDDVSLQFCAKYARICSVFGLKRKQLESIGEGTSCMSLDEKLPENTFDAAVPVVSIDFFKLLTRIVTVLKIAVTPVEYLQFRGGDFIAWMSVECPGSVAGCQLFESGRCKSAFGAKECLSKIVICALMPIYRFQVIDVNFKSLRKLVLSTELERESFLTIKERVSEDKPANVVVSPSDLDRPVTPKGPDSVVQQSSVPPLVPRKRARENSGDRNEGKRFTEFIPDSVVSAALDLTTCRGRSIPK